VGSIITSRGCPYQCSFCSKAVFGNGVRFRSPENVISEIQLLVRKYKTGELIFWDDNFNIDSNRTKKICELIIEQKLDIVWSCNNRVNLFSEEVCSALYEAGCRTVNFGVESGLRQARMDMKKDITSHDIFNAVSLCKKHKLAVSCSFIFGLPGETREQACQTLKFARELNPDYAIFCVFVPMPGSELFQKAVDGGLIDKENQDWERYVTLLSAAPPVMPSAGLSRGDLVALQKAVFRKFYFRGSYIRRHLSRIRSFNDLKTTFRGLYAILRHQIAHIG
jgi:radical SAM superfamily enzyme YgiQ (UPF0313 family)